MGIPPTPVWGFADETGDVGRARGSSRYLIVAIVLTRHPDPLRKAVVKTRKYLGKKLRNVPDLKAKRSPKKVTARFLQYIAELDVEIVAVVLDKQIFPAHFDPEEWYRLVCAEAVRHCIERHEWLKLTLDRRYTTYKLRSRLSDSIFIQATKASGEATRHLFSIEHGDSVQEKGVQAAEMLWSGAWDKNTSAGMTSCTISSKTKSLWKMFWGNRKTGSPWGPILTVHTQGGAW